MVNKRVTAQREADGIWKSVDPDQKQSELGLHCLLRPICPNIYNYCGISEYCASYSSFPNFRHSSEP